MTDTLTSLGAIARLIKDAAAEKPRILVGIVGPPAAGKTTIAEKLVTLLGPRAVALSADGFHLSQKTLESLGRRDRMGASDTFFVDGMLATLHRLLANSGNEVLAPGFDREVEEAIPDAVRIGPERSIIVVEGNYLLLDFDGWEQVAPLLDLSFFVRIEQELRMQRLVDRHVRYGKTADAAITWANGPDAVNARLIGGTADRADHIIELTS